jgi:uncharacterized lipoprotein YbaY/heat shock protein HslJ
MEASSTKYPYRWMLALAALALLAACREPVAPASEAAAEPPSPSAAITGTISYRERLALTDRARVEITLEDVSRQDVAATVLSRQTLSSPGQVPIRYELTYDPAEIDERMSYAVRAKIHDRGRLLFTTDTHTPVLTRGAGREAHLLLVQVAEPDQPAPASRSSDAGMDLEGMFRYLADAATFRDCRDGRTYPVAMEGEYKELERAYLNSGISGGEELFIRVRGRYLQRSAMEQSKSEINLIVDKVDIVDPQGSCAPSHPVPLRNTYWKLLEIDGKPVATPEGMREAHMVLALDEARVSGHAGCNGFFGSFEVAEEQLEFSALGATMMACPQGMDTEQAFLRALGQTTRFTISGAILTLFDDDLALARLEAVSLP